MQRRPAPMTGKTVQMRLPSGVLGRQSYVDRATPARARDHGAAVARGASLVESPSQRPPTLAGGLYGT